MVAFIIILLSVENITLRSLCAFYGNETVMVGALQLSLMPT
ncbi:MAG: hypothetical protein RMX96_04435 [Nostoc sp. ChiSLP02]|nr:hypothetical protein [Nostoc sp. ChiSLP02]